MKTYAVDVVLLPPPEVMEMAISLNNELLKVHDGAIKLSEKGMMPHISLAMGTLQADQLPQAQQVLDEASRQFDPLLLDVPEIHVRQSSKGHAVSSLAISPSEALQQLHEWLVAKFRALLGQNATDEMFHSSPNVAASSIQWVNQYLSVHTHKNFWPHITLGMGELPNKNTRLIFTAGRVALCHLGNHCTCREILVENVLKGKK